MKKYKYHKVYVSGLPYIIEDITFWENQLRTKFESFAGKIKNIKIFTYKDFLSVKQKDQRTYSLAPIDNIESIFLPFQNPENQKDRTNNLAQENVEDNEKDKEKTIPSIGDILKNLDLNIEISSEEKSGFLTKSSVFYLKCYKRNGFYEEKIKKN